MPEFDVFISYNRADAVLARALAVRMVHEAGLRVWIDEARLQPGVSWRAEIEEALNDSAAVLILWGPAGLGPVQLQERDLAYVIRDGRPGFRVVYALLPEAPPPRGSWANVDTWVRFEGGIDEADVFARLAAVLKGQAPPAALDAELPDDPAPYRGLAAFGRDDAAFFHGRSEYVVEMLERLRHHPFLALVGASGSGKTSLVQAGLLPRVPPARTGGGAHWALVRPGPHPLRSLAARLGQLQMPADPVAGADRLHASLAERPESLPELVQLLAPDDTPFVLVIDRLEELFTLSESEDERRAFIGAVAALANHPHRPAWVVATMRADFYGHLGRYPELADLVIQHQLYLKPLRDHDVREVIEAPAAEVGATFEKGLAGTLREQSRVGGETALPLLQHTLDLLWRGRRGRWLTWDVHKTIGGVAGALSYHAGRVVQGMSATERDVARRILSRLVWLDDASGMVASRRVEKASLAEGFADARLAEAVLQRLADERLVTVRGDGERATVELIHDTLPAQWSTLREWIQQDREFLVWRQGFGQDREQWARGGEDGALLLRGAPLAVARKWARTRSSELNTAELAYLRASQRATTTRRTTARAAAVLGVLAVTAGAAWSAFTRTDAYQVRRVLQAAPPLTTLTQDSTAGVWYEALVGFEPVARRGMWRSILHGEHSDTRTAIGSIEDPAVRSTAWSLVAEERVKAGRRDDAAHAAREAVNAVRMVADSALKDSNLRHAAAVLASTGMPDSALAAAREMRNELYQRSALADGVEALAMAGRVPDALRVAGEIPDGAYARIVAVLAEEGRLEEADSLARTAQGRDRSASLEWVALALARSGRMEEALNRVDSIRDSRGRFALGRVAAGEAETGHIHTAMNVARRIALMDTTGVYASSLAALSPVLAETGGADSALAVVSMSQSRATRSLAFSRVAVALANTGRPAEAAQAARNALGMALQWDSHRDGVGGDMLLYYLLTEAAGALGRTGQHTEAWRAARRIHDPDSRPEALVAAAEGLAVHGAHPAAEAFLDSAAYAAAAARTHSARSRAYGRIAEVLARLGRLRDARVAAGRAEISSHDDRLRAYAAILRAYTARRAPDVPAPPEKTWTVCVPRRAKRPGDDATDDLLRWRPRRIARPC